jgi:hypothetical protein
MTRCGVEKLEDGTEICSLHRRPLQNITTLSEVRNGVYPEMVNTFYCSEGNQELTTPFAWTHSLSGDKGTAIFCGSSTCPVKYRLTKHANDWRGWVWHAEGDPHWNPIVPLDSESFTLVLESGRRVKVVLRTEHGAVAVLHL